MAPLIIVAARRGRAALGRRILGTLAGAAVVSALLLTQPGRGFEVPPPEISGSGNALILPAASHGRCSTDVWIGKTRFRGAIADTGADGFLTIGKNQAQQAGIDVDRLKFGGTYESAHGRGHYAETRVRRVRIGSSFQIFDMPVVVTDVDQPQALIGIELLRELNFRVRADHCELSWEERA
jgi:clan AA aspartic protease (TIGR02281 family)